MASEVAIKPVPYNVQHHNPAISMNQSDFPKASKEPKEDLIFKLSDPATTTPRLLCDKSTTAPVNLHQSTDNIDNGELNIEKLKLEDERLKTFEKWPVSFLSPKALAQNGFYYLGRGDEVRCAFCRVEIMRWEKGDDPAQDHKRWAPQCPFVKQQSSAGGLHAVASSSRDECGVRDIPARSMPRPVHLDYATDIARQKSFKDWPRSMRQKPEELAEAGFFYTGQGDKTKCFYCDGGLKDWEDDDVPWEQHARWFDRCPYVHLMKGKDYIQRVKSEACVIHPPKQEPQTPIAVPSKGEDEHPISDSKLCKICFDQEHNIVFLPCAHVVACAKCAITTDKCPMCRTPIANIVKVYFS